MVRGCSHLIGHNREYTTLLANDELRKEMRTGAVFAEFEEGDISFNPTFKVVRTAQSVFQEQVRVVTDVYRASA